MHSLFVVDDDAEQCELLAQALAAPGRRVRAFADPLRALAALAHEPADLLIVDLSMPWIDGSALVAGARLRAPDVAVILVSGYGRAAEVARQAGVPFLPKPLDLGRLRATVDDLLAERGSPSHPAR